MSEQGCHAFTGVVWECSAPEGDLVLCPAGYCPTCGTKLLADGTEQAMVQAVTPEAVKATKLWELLAFADHDVKTIPTYAERLDEYDTLHLRRRVSWEDEKGSYYWWELTEQGRTIHAALQQARGHLTMTQQDLSQYDDGTGDADLREGLRRCREVNGQALASLASGEPTTDDASRTAESE